MYSYWLGPYNTGEGLLCYHVQLLLGPYNTGEGLLCYHVQLLLGHYNTGEGLLCYHVQLLVRPSLQHRGRATLLPGTAAG